MSDSTKELIKSALITFVAGVTLVVVPQLDALTMESVRDGALVGLLFTGVRTGIKMVLEMFLVWYSNRK